MPRIHARERLILALDVATVEEADKLLDRLDSAVQVVKVGLELFTKAGPHVVDTILARGKRVFLDLKFLDIDETVRRATARVASLGVEFLTVHAQRKALAAAVAARNNLTAGPGLKILAVTVLTNTSDEDLREMGVQVSVKDLVTARARMAMEVGADGVVASGEEASLIRKEAGSNLVIVTPGIRPAESSPDDHARVSTPALAIAAGSDYLVVGRPIRDAADPRTAAESIIAEMQAAFDSRGE